MVRTLHKISTILLIALGVVHTALTPVFYGRFSLNALWFAGSGLTMTFLGFLNIAMSRSVGRDRLVQILCYIANLITTAFGGLLVRVDSDPQVIFGLVLIVLITVTAFMLKGEGA